MPVRRPIKRCALAVAALSIMATVFVSHLIREAQAERINSVVETYAGVFSAKIQEQLHARFSIAEMARRSWTSGQVSALDEFGILAENLRAAYDDFQALNWVGPDGVIAQVNPLEGNEAALGLDLSQLEVPWQALLRSVATDQIQITSPINLAQGGRGITAYLPVRVGDEIQGYVNQVFRVGPLIENVLGDDGHASFHVTVFDGDEVLFAPEIQSDVSPYAVSVPLGIGGRKWTATIAPSSAEIADAQTFLEEAVFLVGIVLSVSVALLMNEAAHGKETLRKSEERFALAMKGASDGLFDIDYAAGEVFLSPRWYQTIGYEANELPMCLSTFESLLHPDDKLRVMRTPPELFRLPGDIVEEEFRMRHKDGSWVNILSRAFILRGAGRVDRVVGTHVDITELRRQQSELERAASTDDLTGLRNRRGMSRDLQASSIALEAGKRLALFHIDLDRFKAINDSNGHEAGDHLLRVVAGRLRSETYGFDIVARAGGDEFLVARTTDADDSSLLETARRVVEDISRPVGFEGKRLRVSASIGIAFVDSRALGRVEQAAANADIALYTSKSLGMGRCIIFEPGMRDAAVQSVQISTEIREGLERGEFRPFLQPQVDTQTNSIIGFEALARWYHPSRGVLGAAEFIPFAEDAHLVEAIDQQIFEQACAMVPKLEEVGAPGAAISVNISAARLSSSKLADRLIEAVQRSGIEVNRLRIEILESTLLSERTTNATRNIAELAAAGFKLELDDFGTGHTAIASLRNFPVSRIKIDRSLISGVQLDPALQAISSTIIDLGAKLGIEVLAEGVETEEERLFLERLGCSQMQGFLLAPPLAWEELESWIALWSRRPEDTARAS